jgi:thiol-disulfide isomerase/thioredoxin
MGIVFIYERDSAGAAVITMASVLSGPEPPEYRPVLWDGKKNRYLPERTDGGGQSGRSGAAVSLGRWRMDPKTLPAEKVALIGIEALTPEFHRHVARQAFEKARQAGVEAFPYPEVGHALDFAFTTIDGKKVNSLGLRDHVLLIDFWASWCAPCMQLLPEVRQLYDRRHKEGLEVIGVSLDYDAETIKKTCHRLNLSWPQVLVPVDQKKRDLWQDACGISTIPRLLIVDRQGVLRLDLGGKVDEEQIVALLKGPSAKSK